MQIGIIGAGIVGKSVHNMLDNHEVFIYDPPKNYKDIDVIKETEAVFICVPTPTIKGKQNDSYVLTSLFELNNIKYEGLIIIKSTVLPTSEAFNKKMDIMVAPEFLNQYEPFFIHEKHLIGVKNIYQAQLYREIFNLSGYGGHDIRTTDIKTACIIKYVHNCYGAMKVTFFNEMFDLCQKLDINYREMIGGLLNTTDHISYYYTQISSDGKRGFAGGCFPKDIVAFSNEFDVKTLKNIVDINTEYRSKEMEEVL